MAPGRRHALPSDRSTPEPPTLGGPRAERLGQGLHPIRGRNRSRQDERPLAAPRACVQRPRAGRNRRVRSPCRSPCDSRPRQRPRPPTALVPALPPSVPMWSVEGDCLTGGGPQPDSGPPGSPVPARPRRGTGCRAPRSCRGGRSAVAGGQHVVDVPAGGRQASAPPGTVRRARLPQALAASAGPLVRRALRLAAEGHPQPAGCPTPSPPLSDGRTRPASCALPPRPALRAQVVPCVVVVHHGRTLPAAGGLYDARLSPPPPSTSHRSHHQF